MKKYIKSVFLMGMVIFHSAQTSAFGSRQIGEYSIAAALLAWNITQSVGRESAVQEFRTYVQPSNLWKKYIEPSYEFIFPTQFDHLTASEISGIAKDGYLQADAQQQLTKELHQNAPKGILFAGPAGTGKTTAAKMTSSQIGAVSYYKVSKAQLDSHCRNQFSNTVNEANKVATMHWILTQVAKRTTIGKAVVLFDEVGEECLKTNPNIDLYKDFGTAITGDGTTQPLYPNVLPLFAANVERADIHDAMERRFKIIGMDQPNGTSRIELFKKCDVNIEENSQKIAEGKINSVIKNQTFFDNLKSYFWNDAYNRNNHDIIKADFKEKYLVTDEMFKEADEKYKNDLAGFEQDKKNVTIPWSLATLFSYEGLRAKRLADSEVSFIDTYKIPALKNRGPVASIVTTNFSDLLLKEEELNLPAHVTEKDKAYILEKNPRFLAEKTKTKIIDGKTQVTTQDDLNNLYKKADLQEQEFIQDIAHHVKYAESSTVTENTNPALFEKMNLHRKYCAPTLSTSTNKEDKKAVAKISADNVTSYTIDPTTRTYVAHTDRDTTSSAPITFGAVTTSHLAAAAYGNDFKEYEKQDAAAPTIQKLFKNIKAKNANLKSVIENRIEDKKTYCNKPAAIEYAGLKDKELNRFTSNARSKMLENIEIDTKEKKVKKQQKAVMSELLKSDVQLKKTPRKPKENNVHEFKFARE